MSTYMARGGGRGYRLLPQSHVFFVATHVVTLTPIAYDMKLNSQYDDVVV